MMRFAGLSTVIALSACALPPAVEFGGNVLENRRDAAVQHGQLALAYLAADRADVAYVEIGVALDLLPGDAALLHTAALVEAAAGRQARALMYFSSAVAALGPAIDDDGVQGKNGISGTSGTSSINGTSVTKGTSDRLPRGTRRVAGAHSALERQRATLYANYAAALCDAGQVAEARKFEAYGARQREIEQGTRELTPGKVCGALSGLDGNRLEGRRTPALALS
jgi:tetratricopeptide (TPR) repeat protein